jgi:hypothetical protein
MSIESYAVAVKVSLVNHVTPGLLSISKGLNHAGMDADKLNSKLASIGKQAAIGAAMFGAGLAIAGLLKAPLEEAKKLAQAKADFSTLNLSAADNEKVFAAASMNAHKNLGMTITDNIKLMQDLHTATGSLSHALEIAPDFSQFAIAAKIRNGGKSVDGLVMNAAKALEHRGDKVMMRPDEFHDELNMMSKVYFGTKGVVNPNDYYKASKTGGMSYSLLDKEFLYGKFAGLMSMQSGDSAGTSLMTSFSSLVGGHMDNKAKGFLAELGLLQVGVSKEQVKLTREAVAGLHLSAEDSKKMMKAMMPVTGGLSAKYLSMYASRPDLFSDQVLVPAIRQKFGKDLTNEQVAEIETKYFNRGTSKLLGPLVLSGSKLEKDAAIFGKSMGFGQAYQMYRKSPEGAELAAGEAWKNFLALVGSVYLPIVTKGLEKLAHWLDVAGQYIEKNPEQIKSLTHALMGLSAFLITGGLINMVIAAGRGFWLLAKVLIFVAGGGLAPIIPWLFRMGTYLVMAANGFAKFLLIAGRFLLMNPIGLAITAIVVLGLLLWNNWKEISGALKLMWSDMKDGFTKLFHGDFAGAFTSFKHLFLLGWQTIFNTLIAGFNTIMPASLHMEKMHFADPAKQAGPELPGILPKYHFPAPVVSLLPGLAKQPAPSPLVAPVPSRQSVLVQLTQPIHLDGKKIAESVTKHQAQAASKPNTGTNSFDPSRSMLMPGTPSAVYPRG